MKNRTRLILFDVDGTLVDSQDSIVAAIQEAFDAIGYPLPDRPQILSIVGLSITQAFEVLIPGGDQALNEKACNAYKASFTHARVHQENRHFLMV